MYKRQRRELNKAKKRIAEIDSLIQKIYLIANEENASTDLHEQLETLTTGTVSYTHLIPTDSVQIAPVQAVKPSKKVCLLYTSIGNSQRPFSKMFHKKEEHKPSRQRDEVLNHSPD